MKKRSDKERLQDILDATMIIESYLASTDEGNFAKDRLRQDAILRRIEIISEAGRNVSAGFRRQHREIPWSQMIHMPNRMTSDHFKVVIPVLWETAKGDIPRLKRQISELLKEL